MNIYLLGIFYSSQKIDTTLSIAVNLAPADLPKESGRYDLPIALGILAASGQIPTEPLSRYEFVGELALTGELRPIRGALAMTSSMMRDFGRDQHNMREKRAFILPSASAAEAALVREAIIYPANSLLEVCAHLSGHAALTQLEPTDHITEIIYPDFSDVKAQSMPKRALEIAAAGGHSVILSGPPGTGKSMLGSRFVGILPAMTEVEALESSAIQSLNGNSKLENWKRRSYRNPHHTASGVALVGGGGIPRPGEISLVHHGLLFLDEPQDELINSSVSEDSQSIRARVEKARVKQMSRQNKANNLLGTKEIDAFCTTSDAGLTLLKTAISRLNLSARAYHRILKVARTLADLSDEADIQSVLLPKRFSIEGMMFNVF